MLRLGRNGTADVFVGVGSARNRDIYQRYATVLYRQAFWTLGDAALAEHVVRAVIVDECALAPAARQARGRALPRQPGAWTSRGLVSVVRAIGSLGRDPAWRSRLEASAREER